MPSVLRRLESKDCRCLDEGLAMNPAGGENVVLLHVITQARGPTIGRRCQDVWEIAMPCP
jgi:hypothetical protein